MGRRPVCLVADDVCVDYVNGFEFNALKKKYKMGGSTITKLIESRGIQPRYVKWGKEQSTYQQPPPQQQQQYQQYQQQQQPQPQAQPQQQKNIPEEGGYNFDAMITRLDAFTDMVDSRRS